MTVPARTPAAQLRFSIAITTLAALWLAMLMLGAGPLDRTIYEALYAGGRPALVSIARGVTFLGELTVLLGVGFACALWLWSTARHRLAVVLVLIVLTGRALSEAQKFWIARARPDVEPHLVIVQTSSFPSGHAASSMILYSTLALALTSGTRWHRVAVAGAVVLSLSIGVSRVMLGVHWPSDVIGGWAFGMLWVLLTLRLAQRLFKA